MATAVLQTDSSLTFEDKDVKLHTRVDIDRDKTRYVSCLGNHLESTDRRQLTSSGAWAGGLWIGGSEVGGCPTLKRTNHMVLRGLFSPLETTAVQKKADHRETEVNREFYIDSRHVPPGTRGYTVYAGDDLNYLQGDRYRPMGVVEITSLKGISWSDEVRAVLQDFFFPDWKLWQRGEGEVPVLLSDWEEMVKIAQRKAVYKSHDTIAEELLESARLFRVYANNQIERNRQAIMAMRSADTGGQYVSWHNKCRTYAEQLGIILEDENSIAPKSGDSAAILTELREERKLREKELELLIAKLTGEKIELPTPPPIHIPEEQIASESVETGISEDFIIPEPPSQEEAPEPEVLDLSPQIENTDLTYGCPEFNAKGDPCKARVSPGEKYCGFHKTKHGED